MNIIQVRHVTDVTRKEDSNGKISNRELYSVIRCINNECPLDHPVRTQIT